MDSRDYLLNSYDRTVAERTLEVHLKNGRLSTEDYTNRKLLIAVAENTTELEKIFADIGGTPDTSDTWNSIQDKHGRQLEVLDVICLGGFVAILGVAQFALNVEWAALLLPGIFLVPMIPRIIVDLNRQEELLYYESGMKKK